MWSQSWKNIIDLVLPFEGKRRTDITAEMLRQGYTAHRLSTYIVQKNRLDQFEIDNFYKLCP